MIVRSKIKFDFQQKELDEIANEIQENIRSQESKKAFDWIKRLTIIHP